MMQESNTICWLLTQYVKGAKLVLKFTSMKLMIIITLQNKEARALNFVG